jgi:hypothetical protein
MRQAGVQGAKCPENDEARPMFRRDKKKERPLAAALGTMSAGL